MLATIPNYEVAKSCVLRPAVVEYIALKEGFHVAGSIPARLHNPGALVFCGQPGARRGVHGFAMFTDDEHGWRALDIDVWKKRSRGISLRKGWAYL